MKRKVSVWMLGFFFMVAGLNHFLHPAPYLSMIPPYLPNPAMLNFVSGAAEMAGGAGLLIPGMRRWAGWGLITLLVAVFPANLHVALHGWKGQNIPQWVLWARLPFQPLLITLVYWASVARRPEE